VLLHRVFFFFTLCAAAFAQAPAELDRLWREAVLRKDFAAVERMLADDLVYAHATGIVDTKTTYLEKIKSGRQLYKSMDQKNVSARAYGDTAVTHSWMRVTGVNQAGPFDDKVMMLHVWIKKDGRWLLAAHQTTKVDKLP
jgi:ketosteroid isomerase-like protein